MAKHIRINEKTPCGGDYSEIYYLDKNNNVVDETEAFHCVIRECKANGDLLNETWAIMEPHK